VSISPPPSLTPGKGSKRTATTRRYVPPPNRRPTTLAPPALNVAAELVRRVTQSCVLLGIACAAIALGALSNLSVLERIHVDLGATLHEITYDHGARSAAVRFDRRQSAMPPLAPNNHASSADFGRREVAPPRPSARGTRETPAPASDHGTAALAALPREAAAWDALAAGGCSNTGQGRRLVTDSQGFTCDRDTVSGAESGRHGCCPHDAQRTLLALPPPALPHDALVEPSAEPAVEPAVEPWFGAPSAEAAALVSGVRRFSCASCDPSSQCCQVYELCVACCMAPLLQSHRDLLQAR
jgi:hypothetical protein